MTATEDPYEAMPDPLPILVHVCNTCGEPWAKHEEYRDVADDDGWGDDPADLLPDASPLPADPYHGITLLTCIRVLKDKNMGPSGPPGPMGPMGMSA